MSEESNNMTMKDRLSASAASLLKNLGVKTTAEAEDQQEGSFEQALRLFFMSCTTGATTSVEGDDKTDDILEDTTNADASTPVRLIPSEDETSSSNSNTYPTAQQRQRSFSAPSVRNSTNVSLRNLSALRCRNEDTNNPERNTQEASSPSISHQPAAPFKSTRKPSIKPSTFRKTTNTNFKSSHDLGDHIYEHLFLEEDNCSQGSKRMGIAPPPRLFPASSPNAPKEETSISNKYLTIHNTISEDEISAISAHTLDAMALHRSSSRDSYKAPPMRLNNDSMTTASSNRRYSTPHSRSTSDSNTSFEVWQNSEREYWRSQVNKSRGDATMSTANSTRPDYREFAEI